MKQLNSFELANPILATGKETIEVIFDVNGKQETKELIIPDKPSTDYELDMWHYINSFEEKSWDNTNVGLDTGWSSWNKAFGGGMRPGLYFIAADSNIGKSHVINQLGQQIVDNNEDVFVLDFSLDDPIDDRFSRIIACSQTIPINLVKSPHLFSQYPVALLKRMEGINRTRRILNKFKLFDASNTTNIEDIAEEVRNIKVMFDGRGEHRKIVVLIDNFHDLTTSKYPNLQDNAKYEHLASACADLAIKEDIVIVCTAELRKANGKMRPTPDDVRSASKIKYEAKAIILLYSDLHYRGEAAEIVHEQKGKKLPVLECHFAKNKFDSFKGRTYLHLFAESANCVEVDEATSKKYNSMIFS